MPNAYPSRFTDRLGALGPDELALDCGSGGRRKPHPRCVQLDMMTHPQVDVTADGMQMPFRDKTFSLILSQAVVEHVTDPQRYVDECRRVLRPGGVLYVEIAFMQPVHQAPHHYFNVTPFGLRYLLRDWTIVEDGTTGTFRETISWMARAADVRIRRPSREPSQARMRAVANGVYAIAVSD